MTAPLSRRRWLGAAAAALAPLALRAQQDTAGRPAPAADPLYDQSSDEVRRGATIEETANDATIKAAELRLACPCPCTLDVYTCRTTDFTCSYSPARHREVAALVVEQGMTADQVVDEMVRRYGEEALMAPRPRGFNLVGYVVPAAVVLSLGAVLTAIIALRQRRVVAAPAAATPAPLAGEASPEELARLERELRELDL
ncbi:MAG TPA: cytochrome c-type biogenesis protein CcmH [Gemmatimonadales bacterium]|nr:cytochrome c-type biogenesis protein CcmH [Gemmatimonadales bacterium]